MPFFGVYLCLLSTHWMLVPLKLAVWWMFPPSWMRCWLTQKYLCVSGWENLVSGHNKKAVLRYVMSMCLCLCFKYSCSIGTVPLPEENWNIGSPGQSNHVTCDNQHLPLPGQSCFVTFHHHHHRHEVINHWKQMWCYLPYHEQISQWKIPIYGTINIYILLMNYRH
jgi:hypothetical protein